MQPAAAVAPVHAGTRPGDHRHHREDHEGDRNRPALEPGDGAEADRGKPDLQAHDDDRDDDLEDQATVEAELGKQCNNQVEDDPGVDGAPADGEKALKQRREVGAASAEGASRQHHLAHRRALAHQDEEAEDGHPDQVADHENEDGLHQAQAEIDTECAENPVDGSDVGTTPDPKLVGDG